MRRAAEALFKLIFFWDCEAPRKTLIGSEFYNWDTGCLLVFLLPPLAVSHAPPSPQVLKDIINKYQILRGKKVEYIPGWEQPGPHVPPPQPPVLPLPQG